MFLATPTEVRRRRAHAPTMGMTNRTRDAQTWHGPSNPRITTDHLTTGTETRPQSFMQRETWRGYEGSPRFNEKMWDLGDAWLSRLNPWFVATPWSPNVVGPGSAAASRSACNPLQGQWAATNRATGQCPSRGNRTTSPKPLALPPNINFSLSVVGDGRRKRKKAAGRIGEASNPGPRLRR